MQAATKHANVLHHIAGYTLGGESSTALSSRHDLRSAQKNHCRACCVLSLAIHGRGRRAHTTSLTVDLSGPATTKRATCPSRCIVDAQVELRDMLFQRLRYICVKGKWESITVTNMRVSEQVFEAPQGSVAPARHANAPDFSFTVYADEEAESGFSWNAYHFPQLLRWLLRVGSLRAHIQLQRGPHEIWREASLHLALRDTEACKTVHSDPRAARKRRASSKSLRPSKPRKSSSLAEIPDLMPF